MASFKSLYHSFDSFYELFFDGNEIEFTYNEKTYYLLPEYDEKQVVGIVFGEAYKENKTICRSKDELFRLQIDGKSLGDIIEEIDIVWNNI